MLMLPTLSISPATAAHATMATVINLNKARKQRAKVQAQTLAAANRLKFGRSLAQKQADALAQAAAAKALDGHRLPPDTH